MVCSESGLLNRPEKATPDIYYAILLQGNCIFLSGARGRGVKGTSRTSRPCQFSEDPTGKGVASLNQKIYISLKYFFLRSLPNKCILSFLLLLSHDYFTCLSLSSPLIFTNVFSSFLYLSLFSYNIPIHSPMFPLPIRRFCTFCSPFSNTTLLLTRLLV